MQSKIPSYLIINCSERELANLCYQLRNAKEKIASPQNHLTFLYIPNSYPSDEEGDEEEEAKRF